MTRCTALRKTLLCPDTCQRLSKCCTTPLSAPQYMRANWLSCLSDTKIVKIITLSLKWRENNFGFGKLSREAEISSQLHLVGAVLFYCCQMFFLLIGLNQRNHTTSVRWGRHPASTWWHHRMLFNGGQGLTFLTAQQEGRYTERSLK